MDLALSEEQVAVRDTFRSFFQKSEVFERVRAAGAQGFDPELWQALCKMEAAGIAVSEQDGGAGAGLLDAALVCEQVGRHLAPLPYVETCVAGRLLSGLGSSARAQRVAEGSAIGTLALTPAVDGEWRFVPAGSIADIVVGTVGSDLVCCEGAPTGRALPNLADLPICHRPVDDSAVVIAQDSLAESAMQRARSEWRVLSAAALVGLAQGALDLGVRYVTERTQFGVALATFQSIAHRLADCRAAVDGARLLCYEAAWSLDNDTPDSAVLATMAFYFAAQTAEQVAGASLHFHGGYGFMLEYDIQLFYRRAKAWSMLHGDREATLEEIADRLDFSTKVA